MNKYIAAHGSRLSDEQAQVYGNRIEALQERNDGGITPALVLEDARNPISPLNSWFEWDDSRAAEQYRLDQARYLLRTIHVVVKVHGEEKATRAFLNVTIQEDNGELPTEPVQVYVTLQRVLSDADLRDQAIKQALKQLSAWRHKYQEYQELAHVFAFIDQLELAPEVEAVAA